MINPFDYLYYRMYKIWFWLECGDEPVRYLFGLVLLYGLNLLTIYIALYKDIPKLGSIYIAFFLILAVILICYRPKRGKRIVAEFEKKSEDYREIGNIIANAYIIISICAFVLVSKYSK